MWACFIGSSFLRAQSPFAAAAEEFNRAGFGIYDVSAFSTYSNSFSPISNPGTGTIIPDFSYHTIYAGVSTSIGWRTRKSSTLSFSVRYSPSYYYETSSTGFSTSRYAPSQNLSLSWSKKLGSKWSLSASLSGSLGDYNQMLLAPNGEQSLAALPGASTAFATSVLTGVTGASSVLAAQQSLLYGGRFLNGAAMVSANYALSPRLTLSGTVNGNRMQHLKDSSSAVQTPFVIPQTTGLGAGLGVSYQLSPRTAVNANAVYVRVVSSLVTAPSASLMLGISREITDHLYARISAGAGYLLPYSQGTTSVGLQREQWQAAGTLGYRILRHSFVFTASRTVSDAYGVGAAATLMLTGGWNWSPSRTSWGLNVGGSDIRLQGSQFGSDGYNINGGVRHPLGNRFSFGLSYGYGSFGIGALTVPGQNLPLQFRTQTGRVSLSWRPYLGYPDVDSTIDN